MLNKPLSIVLEDTYLDSGADYGIEEPLATFLNGPPYRPVFTPAAFLLSLLSPRAKLLGGVGGCDTPPKSDWQGKGYSCMSKCPQID